MALCGHVDTIVGAEPSGPGCEECLATGGYCTHLRMCQTCGHVGCCDKSPYRHPAAHFESTSHPLIHSLEPGEQWFWCFVDEAAFELDLPSGPSHS